MAPINCFFWTYACVFHVAHRPYKQPNNVGQAARLRRSETSLVRREKCFHDVVAAGCLGSRVPVSFLLLGWVHKTSGKRLCDSTESDELVLIHTHPRLLLSHAKACWWCCRSKLGVRPRASVSACLPARASVRISSCWRQSEVNFNRDNSGVPLDALELVHARDIAPQDLHVTTGYIFTTNCFLRFFIYLFLNPFNKKRHKIKLNE